MHLMNSFISARPHFITQLSSPLPQLQRSFRSENIADSYLSIRLIWAISSLIMKFHRFISAGTFFALTLIIAIKAGAISVGPSGSGLITFDTLPAVTDFSSRTWGGAGTDFTTATALDAAVKTNSASLF